MRQPLVVGNWKMHGNAAGIRFLLAELIQAGAAFSQTEVAVCPPFVFLPLVTELCAGSYIRVGAQNVSQHNSGAFTGEVSAAMLAELGAAYVLVGHSERRELFAESSETVAEKFLASQAQGLTPILCLGETLQQREGGETEKTVLAQLDAILTASGVEAFANSVLAYEPVWAIGTGKTASPEQAQQVHKLLREHIASKDSVVADAIRILYGGSVKDTNARELFSQPDIDGGLVGGSSLEAGQFAVICASMENLLWKL